MSANKFLQSLQDSLLVCDGAMGTMLYTRGVHLSRCFDELNLSNPDLVGKIHHNYINAGAEVIETNTFGANRFKLAQHALADKLPEIVSSGVRIAREAADSKPGVFVAGSVGPLGEIISGRKGIGLEAAKEAFAATASLMAESGVDFILLETFPEPDELLLALGAVRQACPDLPIVAQAVYNEQGYCGKVRLEELVAGLEALGPSAVGINCRLSVDQMLPLVERIQQATNLPISCQPNVGHERIVEGRDFYLSTPEFMAEYMRRIIQGGGVKMVGACCGSTPEHIRALAGVARMLKPRSKVLIELADDRPQAAEDEERSPAGSLAGEDRFCRQNRGGQVCQQRRDQAAPGH